MDGALLFPGVCIVVLPHSDELRKHLSFYPLIKDFLLVTEGTPFPTGHTDAQSNYRLGVDEIDWNERYIWLSTIVGNRKLFYIIDALKEEIIVSGQSEHVFYQNFGKYFKHGRKFASA